MYNDDDISLFLSNRNYDLRSSHNARWIDQKCTPDVLWSITDFVLDYVDNVNQQFTVRDIWNSKYAKETIAETFSKPGTDEETAENEYDKVFAQPLSMLCYAGVLVDVSNSKSHIYKIENRDVLEYIGNGDLYALRFIIMYNQKVLSDSGLYSLFENFFEKQDKVSFNIMKVSFIKFYHDYTPVKKDYEPKRIFTKVLNPIAYKLRKLGTEKGHLSKTIITKSDLMYNRDNFRDVYKDKPKYMSRKEWLVQNPKIDVRKGYFEQQMNHSKKIIKKFNDTYRNRISELTKFNIDWKQDVIPATQIHHIFPKSDYPEIMHYLENLIIITPNQHYGFAHPDSKTQYVDSMAQKALLIAKTASIKLNLEEEKEKIYDFDNYKQVLHIGLDSDEPLSIHNNDFDYAMHIINHYYDELVKL